MEYLIGTAENTLPAKKSVVFFFFRDNKSKEKVKNIRAQ